MTDNIREAMGFAIAKAILDQDFCETISPENWTGKLLWLDQGEVDFALVADAALSCLTSPEVVERATAILWPLQEWDGWDENARDAARAVITAITEQPK